MIDPFEIAVPDEVLVDMRERLDRARWPNEVAGAGWDQGTDHTYLRRLVDHWRNAYDWRTHEARINALDNYVTEIDGQRIHFVHARSSRDDALPLLLCHGWPGSVVEFLDVFGPLSEDFHVVAPSLPGYGFSGPTSERGWHPRRMAAAFGELMTALGYDRFGVQGGDWGSVIGANVADLFPERVVGLHLNLVIVRRPEDDDPATLTAEEQRLIAAGREWRRTGTGYQEIQGTRPQTLGYALEDSPVGLAAWITEKFREWSGGDIEASFTMDQLLTNITLYWVTRTATSSTRLYYEMRQAGGRATPQAYIAVPTGVACYPAENSHPPRRWVERYYNVTHWAEPPRGGHFAAMEVPDIFVDDVRRFFATVR